MEKPPSPSRERDREKTTSRPVRRIYVPSLHPGIAKPERLQNIAEKYTQAVPGTEEHESLGNEAKRFRTIIAEGTKRLHETRRRRAAEMIEIEERLRNTDEGTSEERARLQARFAQFEAEERALMASAATPLYPHTADEHADDVDIEDLCAKAASDVKQGYNVLKKAGATPPFLRRLLGMPALLATATTDVDAKDILRMREEELADWEDDCGLRGSDSGSGSSSSEGGSDSGDWNAKQSSSTDDGSAFESEDGEGDIAEDAIDWSATALQKTVDAQSGRSDGLEVRTQIRKNWSEQETAILNAVMRECLGDSWWKSPENIQGSGAYAKIEKELKEQGFERKKDAVSSKVRGLIRRLGKF